MIDEHVMATIAAAVRDETQPLRADIAKAREDAAEALREARSAVARADAVPDLINSNFGVLRSMLADEFGVLRDDMRRHEKAISRMALYERAVQGVFTGVLGGAAQRVVTFDWGGLLRRVMSLALGVIVIAGLMFGWIALLGA